MTLCWLGWHRFAIEYCQSEWCWYERCVRCGKISGEYWHQRIAVKERSK